MVAIDTVFSAGPRQSWDQMSSSDRVRELIIRRDVHILRQIVKAEAFPNTVASVAKNLTINSRITLGAKESVTQVKIAPRKAPTFTAEDFAQFHTESSFEGIIQDLAENRLHPTREHRIAYRAAANRHRRSDVEASIKHTSPALSALAAIPLLDESQLPSDHPVARLLMFNRSIYLTLATEFNTDTPNPDDKFIDALYIARGHIIDSIIGFDLYIALLRSCFNNRSYAIAQHDNEEGKDKQGDLLKFNERLERHSTMIAAVKDVAIRLHCVWFRKVMSQEVAPPSIDELMFPTF